MCRIVGDCSAGYLVHLLDKIELGVKIGNAQIIVPFDQAHIADLHVVSPGNA